MSQDKAKIWFFTDIHGSTACFKKFLNLVDNDNKPNVLIIGGDITGKQLVPIVEDEHGKYVIPIGGSNVTVKKELIDEVMKGLSDVGYYPYQCSMIDYMNINYHSGDKCRELFDKLIKERLEEWVRLADAKLPSRDICKVIVNLGNDDPFFADAILDSSSKLIRPEGKVIDLPAGLKLLSTGYSTKTPWKCPRDITEAELTRIISSMTQQLKTGDKLIFNFHCPPVNSSLDLAYGIDPITLRPMAGLGSNPTINVGSYEVRKAIEFWQPVASLHGHIHEVHAKEYIKNTLCFNPGTDYQHGKLQGAFLQINSQGVIEYETLTKEMQNSVQPAVSNNMLKAFLSSLPGIGIFFKNYTAPKLPEKESELEKVRKSLEELRTAVSSLKEQKDDKI